MKKLITFPTKSPTLQRLSVKSVPGISYPASLFWGPGAVDRVDGENYLRGLQAYALSALAYSCMRYRATKIVEAPLWVTEEKDDGEEWLTDHPLAELLERPNPDMEMADLLELTNLYLDGTGRAIWVKTRDRSKRVSALYPFSSEEFTVTADAGRLFGRFTVALRTGNRDFAPEDVIFFRNIDPRNPFDGLAPLDAAISQVNIGQDIRDAVRAQLRNAVRPATIFSVEQPFNDDEERGRFKASISGFAGARKTGLPMVAEGFKIEQLPWGLKELSLGPVQGDVEAAVCSAFQVHPSLIGTRIGLENSSAWADTITGAQNLFYDLFGFPTWSRFEKTLTRGLLREVDDNANRFIRFDKTKVRALQADLGKKTTEANAAANYWTVNERRVHTGVAALPDTDLRGEEIGAAANPFADLFGATGKGAAGAKGTKARSSKGRVIIGTESPKDDERTNLWKSFDRVAREQERLFEREALEQFKAEQADIAGLFEAIPKSLDEELDKLVAKLAGEYKPGGSYYDAWYERYLKLIGRTMQLGGRSIAATLGFDFSLSNPRVQEAALRRANLLAGNVSDTTYEMIQTIVAQGTLEGESSRGIAELINQDVFGDMAEVRSIRIARTETIGALNAGEHLSAELSGVVQSKEWLTQGDDRVRDSHAALDGLVVPIDESFDNGLAYPGDQAGDASEVIQCRCTLLYHDEAVPKAAPRPVINITMPAINIPHEEKTFVNQVTFPNEEGKTVKKVAKVIRDETTGALMGVETTETRE